MKKTIALLLLAFMSVPVWGDEQEELSILLFGHSFGIDSTEHLPALIDAAGIKTVRVARFYKANCSLAEHYAFFTNETSGSSYQYQESAPGTTSWTSSSLTFKQAIAARAWYYVVFQNSLENEGRYETAQPYLNDLVSYVRTKSQELHGRQPEICWNLFWPISKLAESGSNSTLKYRLSFYGNSSEKMWKAYVGATRQLMYDTGITNVVQTGATIMNLRASELNTSSMNEFTRDTYHLSEGAGRYAAACAFFEHFIKPKYGVSVLGNSLRLPSLTQPVTDDNAAILQQCAVSAEANPLPYAVKSGPRWIRESESLMETTGRWRLSTEYADGAVEIGGSNTFEPYAPSDGRYVKVESRLRFSEEWSDQDYAGDAKAAVRLGQGGRLQAYTSEGGAKTWVDVSETSLGTNRDYVVQLRLDMTNCTYCVTRVLDDAGQSAINSASRTFAFATRSSVPIEQVSFEGVGSVSAINGSYTDAQGLVNVIR